MKISDLKDKTIVLSTADKNSKPHSILCEIDKADKNEIVITNNYMKESVKNILENPQIVLIYWNGKEGINIEGEAKHYASGEYLTFVKNLKKNREMPAKGAIVIRVNKVKELK